MLHTPKRKNVIQQIFEITGLIGLSTIVAGVVGYLGGFESYYNSGYGLATSQLYAGLNFAYIMASTLSIILLSMVPISWYLKNMKMRNFCLTTGIVALFLATIISINLLPIKKHTDTNIQNGPFSSIGMS